MKILMIDDIAFVGENMVKGLKQKGYNVSFIQSFRWLQFFHKSYGEQHFDIVHINSPNLKKLGICWRYIKKGFLFSDAKLVCHWHGSDLRHPIHTFPVNKLLRVIGDFHLYSTLDLRWWLKFVPSCKKELFNCPIDTDVFKPDKNIKKGVVEFVGGGKSFKEHNIPHDKMPEYLNRFDIVNVYNDDGLDDGLLSVIALEAVCCGCIVPQIPWLNREWVVKYSSVNSQTDKLINIYKRLLSNG